jgi:hypothetical protein
LGSRRYTRYRKYRPGERPWRHPHGRRYHSEVETAGDVLARWLGKRKKETRLQLYILRNRWAELVGERIALRTLPQSLRDGLLTVAVVNSTWLNELSFMRTSLVQQINAFFNDRRRQISAIRLVAGEVKRPPTPPWSEDQPDAPPEPVKLPPDQVEQIKREVRHQVQDPDLQGSILSARLAQLGRALRFKIPVNLQPPASSNGSQEGGDA